MNVNSKQPLVSVLMAVHNGEEYLAQAIQSILDQTYSNFEFIIINDGSTDKTVEIIKRFNDNRIVLISNKSHLKLPRSLNIGLKHCKGEYVARMDADDISLAQRLEIQVKYMDKHRDIGMCGSWVRLSGFKTGKIWKYPKDPDILKTRLLFFNTFAHPSIMIRRDLLSKHNLRYDETFAKVQDYELWSRCTKYFPCTNISNVLLEYRLNQNDVAYTYWSEHYQQYPQKVRKQLLNELGMPISAKELEIHQNISNTIVSQKNDFISSAEKWLLHIKAQNNIKKVYKSSALDRVIGERWLALCKVALQYDQSILFTFFNSELSRFVPFSSMFTFLKQWLVTLLSKLKRMSISRL